MTAFPMSDAQTQLASDHDGSFRAKLIENLEKYRDEFAFSKQGFLPPDEYEVAEYMEGALNAALSVINDYEPAKSESVHDDASGNDAFSASINI